MVRKKFLILLLLFSFFSSIAQVNQKTKGDPESGIKTVASTGKNMALVVGVSDYQNINRLNYADDDAYLFAQYLIDEKICAKQDVVRLIDSAATSVSFYKELSRLLRVAMENDRVFIYFSGHGDVENNINSGFLLTYNAEPNNYPAHAIDMSVLERYVDSLVKKKVRVVLITDACRSGNLAGGITGAAHTLNWLAEHFKNTVKILSCQLDQLSIERMMPGGGHGIFTYHLVDGLSGLADKNNDLKISLKELDRYLDIVGEDTKDKQTPKVEGDPSMNIVQYDATLKKALLARKTGSDTTHVDRSKNNPVSAWNDNKYFKQFQSQVRRHNYLTPNNDNAYFTLLNATKYNESPAMIFDMKLDLIAAMEDEAQKLISKYTRGEAGTNERKFIEELEKANGYMAAILKLIDSNDLRYSEIKIKKDFFHAFIIFRKAEYSKYQQANALINDAIKMRPGQAWLHNLSGMFYLETKGYSEAEKRFKEAAELSPTWAYPWYNLGNLSLAMGRDTALKNITRTISPDSSAIIYYNKAISLDSGFSLALNNLAVVYEGLKQYSRSELLYRKAIQNDPENGKTWLNLAYIYVLENKLNEGEMAYREAMGLDSNYVWVWNNIGLINRHRKNYVEAEANFKKVAALYPTWASPWYNLAELYKLMGDDTKSSEARMWAKKIDDYNFDLKYRPEKLNRTWSW